MIKKFYEIIFSPIAYLAAFLSLLGLYLLQIAKSEILLGDAGNNVNVARNLLAGKGFTINYLWHYFKIYPTPFHPEDAWPIMQPIWEAISILLFGDNMFAHKFPNIVLLATMSIAVYKIATNLFDKKTAVLAAILTLSHPLLSMLAFMPYNHLGAALFFLLGSYFASKNRFILAGFFAGISYLHREMGGATLTVGLLLFLLFKWQLRSFLTYLAIFILTIVPLWLRNYLEFGNPFYSIQWTLFQVHKLKLDYVYLDYDLKFNLFDFDQLKTIVDIIRRDFTLLLRHNFGEYIYPLHFMLLFFYFFKERNGLLRRPASKYPSASSFARSSSKQAARYSRANKRDDFFILNLISFVFFEIFFLALFAKIDPKYHSLFLPIIFIYIAKVTVDGVGRYFAKTKGRILADYLFAWLIIFVLLLKSTVEATIIPIIKEFRHPPKLPIIEAYKWIDAHIDDDRVFMTKETINLNYYTRNPAVNIPPPKGDVDYNKTLEIMKKYQVSYLFLEQLDDPQRLQLKELYEGSELPGFKKIYEIPHHVLIYQVSLESKI